MLKLSKRLMMTANCVTKGSSVADIGCDHAYLSIYLVVMGIAEKVIAMDVNKGPLKIAEENISRYNVRDKIKTRLSDGLNMLKPFEADAIVLAGMGGGLMVSILTKGIDCVIKAKELILSPQSEPYKVRRFLKGAGYHILYEDMCIDMGKYYTVIKAVNMNAELAHNTENIISTEDIFNAKDTLNAKDAFTIKDTFKVIDTYNIIGAEETYGEYLLKHKNEVLKEYLNNELIVNKNIQGKLNEPLTKKAYDRLIECKEDEARIKHALEYYKD